MNQDPAVIAQSDREGLAPTTPPFQANSSALAVLPQIQSRLLHLAGQLDEMQARLDQLSDSVQDNSVQLDALLGTFLTGSAGQVGDERLAELALQLEITREQVEQMHSALALVATQEQISSLARALAGHERLSDVADSVKKLGRTQFKANTLGETREQQIESALSLARELVTQRGELATDLLPALDGIELALEAGRSLLARRRHELADARARHVAAQRDWDTAQARGMATASSPPIRTSGVWDRLRRSLAGDSAPAQPSLATPALLPPAPPAELDLASELVDATRSWLSGLELVRERFAALLALEAIQPLPALGQPFDPRLHLAIEAETRSDVPANTVVRVLRQGYRQRQRVLRYAEVVVARAPVDSEPEPDPVHPEENDHES